ncbi:hypothetical protein ACQJBY_045209 [Aegilops geniculata]
MARREYLLGYGPGGHGGRPPPKNARRGAQRAAEVDVVLDELLDLVFLRLPSYLDLVRAECACRRWRRVIAGGGGGFLRRFGSLRGASPPPPPPPRRRQLRATSTSVRLAVTPSSSPPRGQGRGVPWPNGTWRLTSSRGGNIGVVAGSSWTAGAASSSSSPTRRCSSSATPWRGATRRSLTRRGSATAIS